MVRPEAPRQKGKVGNPTANGHRPVNFRELAPVYVRQGYVAPIPLPQGRKSPPPTGFTGHGAEVPTAEQIEKWRETRGGDGIGFVLQPGEILIDVDNYAKGTWPAGTGAATMAEARERAGCGLPPGPKLRNRTDGSEKRPFRVPQGLKLKKSLGPCVDIVTPTHRYVNAGVNPDTGNPEQWSDADDNPLDEPPPRDTWPELPEAWLPLVIQSFSDGPTSLATVEQAQAWLDGMPDGAVSSLVQEQLDHALAGLDGRCLNPNHGARHDCSCEHVRWLVEMGAAGVTGVPAALGFLREQFIEAVKDDRDGGEHEAAYEFDGFVSWGARVCRPDVFYALRAMDANLATHGEPIRLNGNAPDDNDERGYRVFTVMEPAEWAAPVADVEMLIAKALCRDTSGPNAGPKKSLKTHDNQAIAFAVSTGLNLYLSEHFPVKRQGQVLYIVGEGGQVPVQRTLHRMARAYGLNVNDVMLDPAFPLVAAFGAAPLDSPRFRDDLKRMLDTYQPVLVLIESFYNFHPADVNAANLFERGPVIDAYHKSVKAECAGATSMMTDHYRSTGTGKSLDLDSISMAGQAENADSWITRYHRKKPNVPEGEFWLQLEFGSRQWGATEWQIDWQLGPFNHDVGHHVGKISWDVRPAAGAGEAEDDRPRIVFETDDEFIAYLRDYVERHPKMTQTEILAAFEVDTQRSRADIRKVWAKAREGGWITKKSLKRTEKDPRGAERQVTRTVWLPGKGQETLNEERAEWGGETV